MSKEKIKIEMVDEEVQTDALNTTTSSKGSNSSSPKGKEVIENDNVHDRAYKYLEGLEVKYANELDSMYAQTGKLIDIVRKSPSFHDGIKNAIEEYQCVKSEDKGNFILVQFLEEFYERYIAFIDEDYTSVMHENNFKEALSLSYSAGDQKLLGELYDIHNLEQL